MAAATTARAVTRIPARCGTQLAPRLCAIHHHRTRVNALRRSMWLAPIPYKWLAEKYPGRRDRILTYWTKSHRTAVTRYAEWRRQMASYGGIPYWAAHVLACISVHEEYGIHGSNSPAGYFGMPSSPSSYPTGSYWASVYGDSWYSIPLAVQFKIAYAEYLKYGWYRPWSTAATALADVARGDSCGL